MSDKKTDQERERFPGITLMDPNNFGVVDSHQTVFDIRLHHIGSLMAMKQDGIFNLFNEYGYKGIMDIDKKFSDSEKFTEDLQLKLAKAISSTNAASIFERLKAGDKKQEEYIGKNGEHVKEYEEELNKMMLSLLKLGKNEKIHLVFSTDQICQISQGGRGPVAHCSSEAVHNDDMLYWYAINSEASYLKEHQDPRMKEIGLVDMGNNRYDTWITAGLLRSGFSAQVFENFLSLAHSR
jgi:hypothetical protein